MKSSIIASALALVAPIIAGPVVKRDAATDLLVLQFALTLEHLEDYFYSHALRRIPRSDFFKAGFDQTYYDNMKRITDDEKSHVALLTSAITAAGGKPVLECEYNFGDLSDIKNFLTLSSILEGVGTSAYLGGAPLISNKDYLTVAGSILVTEALHTSYQRNAVKEVPFATPYGTPLDPNSVYTLAAAFITDCPKRASSFDLGFKAYPTLSVTSTSATPVVAGTTVTFTSAADIPSGAYLTFVSGLSITSVQATVSGKTASAQVPAGNAGQVYVLLNSKATDGKTTSSAGTPVAGPAIVEVQPEPPMFLN